MLASFVLDPGRRSHALDELARERLSLALGTYAELVGRGRAERPFAAVPLADAARYCAADSEIVLRLHDAFRPELEDHQLMRLLETIEMRSEEHTSELQSHSDLVCRLLLEKKKQKARLLPRVDERAAVGGEGNGDDTR